MTEYDSRPATEEHIARVGKFLDTIIMELIHRKEKHDASKLVPPEKETFDRVTPLLAGMTYGSEEYKATMATMQEALQHHYAHNAHHPERFSGGIRGMTLVDIVEMFCDWCAATERHDDGDIGKSIDHNMKRFGFGENLASIMVNTAQLYSMGRGSHRAYRPVSQQEGSPK